MNTFRRILVAIMAVVVFAGQAAAARPGGPRETDTLGRFFAKAAGRQPVVVGFLGGSITEGTGASSASKCWRSLTCDWLRTHYPGAKWTFLSAAVGGTGSELGVFRLRQEILDRAMPDLVFVEFAVNDEFIADRSRIVRPMEGIVRQIREANPQAAIVFVYTVSHRMFDNHKSGRPNPATDFQREVAAYYALPEIDFQKTVFEMDTKGGFQWKDYWGASGVHPNDRGYALYYSQVGRFLEQQSKLPAIAPGKLPEPMLAPTYENARLIPIETKEARGWTSFPPQPPFQGARVRSIAQASEAGAEVKVEFQGPLLGVYFESGPDAGQFDVAIDDLPPIRVKAYDPVNRFRRPNYRIVKADLTPGKHVARLISLKAPAGSTGGAVRLGGLLELATDPSSIPKNEQK